MTRRLALGVIGVASLLGLARPAAAQRFGQWSWEGLVGGGGDQYDNTVGGTAASSYRESRLGISLGINGFIVHPAVARFHLGIESSLSRYKDGTALNTNRLGYLAHLEVFPEGRFPVRLYASRQRFDYGQITQVDPLLLLNLPDTTTTWGGRVRLRGGPLRGLQLGADRTTMSYSTGPGRQQVEERYFADYSRGGRNVQSHFSFERELRDFAASGYRLEDFTTTLDEHGQLAPRWRWDLSATGVRRNFAYREVKTASFDAYTLRNSLVRTLGNTAFLDLSYTGGLGQSPDIGTSQSHDFLARLALNRSKGLELAPFVGYSLQRAGDVRATIPRAGLNLGWARQTGSFNLSLTAGGSVGVFQREKSPTATASDQTFSSYSAGVTIGHGNAGDLREEIDLSWSRNELRRAGETLADLPDLGQGIAGPGTQNVSRARLTLAHASDRLQVNGYGEWTRRELANDTTTANTADTFASMLQLRLGNLTVGANSGSTRLEAAAPQRLEYLATWLRWKPLWYMSLEGTHRIDRRRLQLQPSFDSKRTDGGLDISIGEFTLAARVFVVDEELVGGTKRTNRGFQWTVSRRLAGWLPIVSAPERRGVVR